MVEGFHLRAIVGIVLASVFVGSIAVATPGAALAADSCSTYANPEAPGATVTYRITVVAQQNDTVVRNGLERITLNYGPPRISPGISAASQRATLRSLSGAARRDGRSVWRRYRRMPVAVG
jgi:hypothetical protein